MADTIHFVGGYTSTTGASLNNGGGGIASLVSDPRNLTSTEMLKFMNADGSARFSPTGCGYTSATGVIAKSFGFAYGLEGLYVYCQGATITSGRYLITASTVDTITIDTGLTDDVDVDVWVGGALASMAAAVGGSAVPTATATSSR